MKRMYTAALLLFCSVLLYSQEGYSDYLNIMNNTEQKLLLPVDQIDFMQIQVDLNSILDSHYSDLYPGARTLLFLADERFEQWKEMKTPSTIPPDYNAVYIPAANHFSRPAYISSAAGILGYTGFISLKLWAEHLYYNDYLTYGPGDESAAADAKRRWRAVDTASFIALGIGTAGLMMTPILNNYGSSPPRKIDDETAVLLKSISARERYNALVAKREKLKEEHERAVRQRPRHRGFTLASLGLTIASGVATGIFSYLGREAYEDYSSAVFTDDAQKARKEVELYDTLTISAAAATGVFTLSTTILSNTAPKPEELEREILAIDYQLDNWIGF